MDEVTSFIIKANKFLDVADHLTYVTYPMVNEPKLGFTIAEHLFNACVNAMDALLYYEYLYKRINSYPQDNFIVKVDIFKRQIAPRYNIDRKYIFIMEDLHTTLVHRQKSKVEFVRKDKLIMCDDNFGVKTLTMEKIKNYVYESKNFLAKINSLLRVQNVRRY